MSNKKLKISDGDLALRVSSLFSTGQLTKGTVGLAFVDNTSDADKPVSSAAQTVFNSKQDVLVSGTSIKTLNSSSLLGAGDFVLTKTSLGLANVDNTSDADKPVSTAAQTALNSKVNTSTTVNGHALSSNINILANEIVGTVVSVSTSTNVPSWAAVIVASATAAPLTITLPAISASTIGQHVAVVKADNSSNIVSVVANGGNTLNGSGAAQTLVTQWDAYIVSNDGVSGAYTLARPGTGGSLNIFQLNGTGEAYTTYTTGIGTSTPAATLDVETAPAFVATSSNYGVVQSPVDEFGYAKILSVTGATSLSVAAHTISVGGVNYPIATTNFSSLPASPFYYVYSDGLSGASAITQVPNELYLAPTTQPGAYLDFENDLFDPFLNAWGNNRASLITLDATRAKFGTTSFKTIDGVAGLQLVHQNKTLIESRQGVYLPAWPTWQMDAWFYVSAIGTAQTQFLGSRAVSYASGYGFAIYNAAAGSQNMIIYLSTTGSTWNLGNATALNGTIPLNQWFQLGIRYDSNNFVVNVNGTTTTFASTVNLYNPASVYTYYTSFAINISSGMTVNIDEAIITPYTRAFGAASTFVYTDNSIMGAPFAAYLTGASLTDGYNLNWYGAQVAGPDYPVGNTSFTLNGTSSFAWSPLCPNLSQCGEWTVEAYMNLATIPASIPLIDLRGHSSDFTMLIHATSTTQIAIHLSTNGTSWNIWSAASVIAVPAATWFHLAVTFSATRGGYNVYLNGVLKLSSVSTEAVTPTTQIVLGTTSSSYHTGTAFTAYMNCFRISPTLVYTGAFTAPTGMLGTSVSRDLITVSTGACNTQGASASLTNKRVYLGSVRFDLQRVREWTPKQDQKPLAKLGQLSVWRDGTLTTPTRSFQLPEGNSYRFFAALRDDGRLYVGGDYLLMDGGTGVPVTNGTWDQYFAMPYQTVPFKRVVLGFQNYFCVDINNTIWACGANTYGVFGDGTTTARARLSPIFYTSSDPVLAVSAADTNSVQSLFVVDPATGNMYACGSNAVGQLGLGTTTQQNTLTLVPKIGGQNWANVWQYCQATWAITDSASGNLLYACGSNALNILGIGVSGGTISTFTQCVTVTGAALGNVKKIISALQLSTTSLPVFALTNNGLLYVTGRIRTAPNQMPGTGSQFNWPGYGFMGPICANVADVCMSGGDNPGVLILKSDGSLWMLNSTNGGFALKSGVCYSIQKAVTDVYGESTPAVSIYGNVFSSVGANMAITNSGSLLVAGTANTIANSLGGQTLNTTIYAPQEIMISGDRVMQSFTLSSTDTSTYPTTFFQTKTGRIYVAGSQYTALGGKFNSKQTFIPIQFET